MTIINAGPNGPAYTRRSLRNIQMRRYLRWRVAGGTYFFTVVTHGRRPILTDPLGRACMRAAFRRVRTRWPFEIVAIVLLPEHLHAVWQLPPGDDNYSLRWQKIKEHFTRRFIAAGGREGRRGASRTRKRERAIWQRRFWEHTCRDEDDLKRAVDYVHWNPLKHGIVTDVAQYPWSSFHRYVRLGEYDGSWGRCDPCPEFRMPE